MPLSVPDWLCYRLFSSSVSADCRSRVFRLHPDAFDAISSISESTLNLLRGPRHRAPLPTCGGTFGEFRALRVQFAELRLPWRHLHKRGAGSFETVTTRTTNGLLFAAPLGVSTTTAGRSSWSASGWAITERKHSSQGAAKTHPAQTSRETVECYRRYSCYSYKIKNGIMFEVHICKHSLFRLKITVGCRLCTYPSIHFSLDEDTLKITVGCLVCACGVCGVWVVCVHVVLCVVLVKLGTLFLSLALSPSTSLSLSLSLSFSLLFLLLFLLLLLLLLILLLFFFFLFSILFSPPNTVERTDQPTQRSTSRHLNVIWSRASAQQSVLPPPLPSLLSLSSSKERELFITGMFPARNLPFFRK